MNSLVCRAVSLSFRIFASRPFGLDTTPTSSLASFFPGHQDDA
ncbi:Hypothetical protein AAM4_1480 [Actinomyces succiniciruminis]|uniref:Uncharacterized protein n=1 Tax=Actinomyces succiniciruminis TaxID=1522002 RepID=A0A1L7RNT5_9ACTO|nr:Hypothetical protein AAM4_1480 [Actinomyces succiniciruminis]